MSDFQSILPSHHAEFKQKEYWDKFFQERDSKAFEWYGCFADMSLQLSQLFGKSDKILIIGCGNSNFSIDLFDSGYSNVVSNDFSELVISEMGAKRPDMVWHVMDMTQMTYEPGSQDVVIDKGALDALMSDSSEECLVKAKSMFGEIAKVLRSDGGRYICITLAESFIFKALVDYFEELECEILIDAVRSRTAGPFLPLLITITRRSGVSKGKVQMAIDAMTGVAIPEITDIPTSSALQQIPRIQEYAQKMFELGAISPGRFESIDLWDVHVSSEIPRFALTISDSSVGTNSTDYRTCAVFFVPIGRETEYIFNGAESLQSIAREANCKRLISVRCNRPHKFGSKTDLQNELSSIIITLRPREMDDRPDELIPFMEIAGDLGWEVLEQSSSVATGEYIIEEREVRSDAVFRRLIYLQNQAFVQTEARLVYRKPKAAGAAGKGKGRGKAVRQKSTIDTIDSATSDVCQPIDEFEFDATYLDGHHRSFLAAMSLVPSISLDRHKSGSLHILIIGLAGAALCMSLQKYFPLANLTIVDLDATVQERIARRYFGFKPNKKTVVIEAEGVSKIHEIATESADSDLLDVLLIDADSKDLSLGMSAPPLSFVTSEALRDMYACLRPDGLLAINVVARQERMLHSTIADIKKIFGSAVYTVKASDETSNVVVIALKQTSDRNVVSATKGTTKPWKVLEDWLKSVNIHSDPLELGEIIDSIKLAH